MSEARRANPSTQAEAAQAGAAQAGAANQPAPTTANDQDATGAAAILQRVNSIDAALLRYRVMAYTVGVGLLILVFVGMPLQFGAGHPSVVQIVGPIHGVLYIVYLLAALDLARRARFSLLQMAAMVGAGLLPFLAFIIEHYITRDLRAGMRSWLGRAVQVE